MLALSNAQLEDPMDMPGLSMPTDVEDLELSVELDDGSVHGVTATKVHFEAHSNDVAKAEDPRGYRHLQNHKILDVDFAYAMTVHKSQGSQWDKVILMDDGYSRKRKQWLYTAATRASESVILGLRADR